MGLRKGETYDFSADVRIAAGSPRVTIELVGSDGTTLASGRLPAGSSEWKPLALSLQPNDTDPKSRLNVILEGAGTVEIDMVSLFPRKTWKDRPGGLRADMVQTLADLHPGFLRFPGGCIVEGARLDVRYQWQKTLGPIEDRELLVNRWNYEFKHRPTPDYYQSFGLGFYEYFQLAEDIGAEPLPILGCGMACQFNSGELVPMDQLAPYIQEALDLIEFANGAVTTPWGKKRAELGHPEPFGMKMLGIGNEQWGPQYVERYAAFHRALKQKHPEIALVSAAGPSPAGRALPLPLARAAEARRRHRGRALLREPHLVPRATPTATTATTARGRRSSSASTPRRATSSSAPRTGTTWRPPSSEAAFMTGLERNADVVRMASYAPLFAHVDGWQWTPDLIWVDNLRVLRTPNYYVQQLFSRNRGDVVLPLRADAPVRDLPPAGRIGLGTRRASAEFKDVRVTSGSTTLLSSGFTAGRAGWTGGEAWSLAGGAFRQPDPQANGAVQAGDVAWKDYTVTLKARKLGGEGGLVVSVYDDGAGARADWVLGAQANTKHALVTQYAQQSQLLAATPGSIEAGRWYDVKIALRGHLMQCFLDGKLVQSADVLPRRIARVYASATREEKTGDIILKVVNPGEEATEVAVELAGVTRVAEAAQAVVLTGAGNDVVNSFDQPGSVAPVTETVQGIGPTFRHRFGPRSLTVLRIGGAASSEPAASGQ